MTGVKYDVEVRLRNHTDGQDNNSLGRSGYNHYTNYSDALTLSPSADDPGGGGGGLLPAISATSEDSVGLSYGLHEALRDITSMYGTPDDTQPAGVGTSTASSLLVSPPCSELPRWRLTDNNATSGWINCSVLDDSDYYNTSVASDVNNYGVSDVLEYKHPALGVMLSCFALVTIVGNSLVIVAVAKERYLRTVTNYFIVSLALADLIIGAVVMPFSISMEITNNFWLFGGDWCDVWHSFDVLASTASILNLSMISLDRYWAITDPIAYPTKMSVSRALILIAVVWLASAAISFPAILWWRAVVTSPPSPDTCFFTEDTTYLIFSSMISFYFPVSVILFAYYRIYKAASEQSKGIKSGSKVMVPDTLNGEAMTLRIHRGGARRERMEYSRTSMNSDSDQDLSPTHTTSSPSSYPPRTPMFSSNGGRPSRVISRKWKHFTISRKLTKLAKEQKAAKTLGIVMGVFCICWVPFFVSNVLFGVCNVECVSHAEIIFPVFTWLGYINSGMNPVIYALSMRDFRRAFIKTLCCCCPSYYRFRARRSMYERSFSTSSCAVSSSGERFSNARL